MNRHRVFATKLLGAVALVLLSCGCGAPPAPPPVSPAPPPVASAAPVPSVEPAVEGVWKGVLGGALHLELSILREGERLDGVLDSVDQGSTFPVEGITFAHGALHFEIAAVEGSFDGRLDAAGRLEGTWVQHGVRQPLMLVRDPSATPRKADPPKKPLDAPIEVAVRYAPSPLRVDDKTLLVYELHVTSFSRRAVSLTRLEILSDAGASMARFEGAELGAMCSAVGASSGPVLGPPLRGGFWKAANGPSNKSRHRRALLAIGGKVSIAQRFAIDWVKIGDDGKTSSGDPTRNASYHAYGSEALAVGDGVVVEVKDGIPENTPGATRAVPITLETVGATTSSSTWEAATSASGATCSRARCA